MSNPLEYLAPCPQCGDGGPHSVEVLTTGVHYAKASCGRCRRFLKFLPKPDDDPTKYKRQKAHLNLVDQYSNGYCEMCLRQKGELPKGETLEAQHVIEYQDGGSEKRENIWILCTSCHRMVHWLRTYHGRNNIRITNAVTSTKLWNESTLPTSPAQ